MTTRVSCKLFYTYAQECLILNLQHVLREQHDNLTCNNKSLSTVLTIYILAPKNSMNENLQVKFISSNIFLWNMLTQQCSISLNF